jgi:ABC-2 type transport system permease protein
MTTVARLEAPSRTRPLPVLRRWLGEGWRGLIGWTAGAAAAIALYLPLYPAMKTPELVGLLDSLPPELIRTLGYDDIVTGAGYTQATFFALIGFVLITIAAVVWASAYTGGAEESGRLELTLAHGVSRLSYAVESALALVVKLSLLGIAAWVLVWVANGPAELDLDPGNLTAVVCAWVGLGLFIGSAAFAAGALTGRRVWATAIGAGVAVMGYALQAVANNSNDLDWLRTISPFHWAYGGAPLSAGADWPGLALLWGGSVLLITVATVGLARRDVTG